MSQATQVTLPIPDLAAGEDQPAFALRCHAELADTYPNTDERNRVCMLQWSKTASSSDPAERKATEVFARGQFTDLPMSVAFAEHVTKDRDGKPLKQYDRNDMATIVRACNKRIRDTGDFAPLTDGHTPDIYEEAAGIKQPDILGYQGPFYLGMIGNEEPRFAVFARERAHAGKEAAIKALPRRSAELHTSDMILDPIAALGATTPKLNLGLRFCRRQDSHDAVVQRYSCDPDQYAAAFAAGGNTFIPSPSTTAKGEKYASAASPEKTNMALSQEDIAQLLAAIDNLDWVRAVKGMLAANAGAGAAADPNAQAGASTGLPADDGSAVADDTPVGDGASPPADDDAEKYAADGTVIGSMKKPAAGTNAGVAANGKPGSSSVADTVKMSRRVGDLERKLAEADGRIAALTLDRRRAVITAGIEKLSRTRVLDKGKELTRCIERFSRLPDADFDKQFRDHCDLIETNYQRIPTDRLLVAPDGRPERFSRDGSADPAAEMRPEEVEKFARDCQDFALANGKSYEEARAELVKKFARK